MFISFTKSFKLIFLVLLFQSSELLSDLVLVLLLNRKLMQAKILKFKLGINLAFPLLFKNFIIGHNFSPMSFFLALPLSLQRLRSLFLLVLLYFPYFQVVVLYLDLMLLILKDLVAHLDSSLYHI